MKAKVTERSRILNTRDYSLFKMTEMFRIRKLHLHNLIEGMKDKNLSKDLPIIIDADYNILDGKYRFLANKALGEDIYYKVAEAGNYMDFMIAKDVSLKLVAKDYAILHANNINYRKLLEACDRVPFSFDNILNQIVGINYRSHKIYRAFKNGEFVWKKTFDYKINCLKEVCDEWNRIYDSNIYQLKFNDVFRCLDYNEFVTVDAVKEFNTDETGYIKKFMELHKIGYPYSPSLSDIIDELGYLEQYGHKDGAVSEGRDYYGCIYGECVHLKTIDKILG